MNEFLTTMIPMMGVSGWQAALARSALLASGAIFLLAMSWVDLRRWIIPNSLLLPGALLILALRGLFLPETLPGALAGGVLGWTLFWLLARLADGDLGGGDVRLAGFIGLLTGVIWVIPALLLGMLLGGLTAFGLTASGRVQMDEGFPYGPALSLGAAVVLVMILI
jgi:leader peptidase (prepilin peptidase)/N-methyltransferase